MNDARRKVEREAPIAPMAEELATAAQAVLDSSASKQSPDHAALEALRAALARYQEASR